jgi:GTPase
MDAEGTSQYKSGYVAVLGRPNVGKSTLINVLMGQKIAAVSPKPQTTRRRQLGILSLEGAQVVFVDTPGVHQARNKLGETMNQKARETLNDADLILFLADASTTPGEEDQILAGWLGEVRKLPATILTLNKIDQIAGDELELRQAAYLSLFPEEIRSQIVPQPVSALMGLNTGALIDAIIEKLPPGEPFYPPDQITDLYERDIAADLIREAALIHLRDEVPHGISVRIDEFTERGEQGAYIAATVFVERESHKAIVIGQKAAMLKRIGSAARQEIERMSGRKIYLNLKVKVRKNWRNDEKILRWFGYS